jgi:hypothetical protein
MTSVSIVTITQFSRFNCLENLFHLIKLQDCTNIKEWVIVEGSKNINDALLNKRNINFLINNLNPFDIKYIEYTGSTYLSNLRNLGNNSCTCDIIVCMDDDDYYPPTKISSLLQSFKNRNSISKFDYKIAGCSAAYMYDYDLNKLYKFNKIHNNHSTNNCMAFNREYLKNNKHQEGLNMAEESSFTNCFTENMIQLNPIDCIVISSHFNNTYNKKRIIQEFDNPYISEVTNILVTDLIPIDIFKRMQLLF